MNGIQGSKHTDDKSWIGNRRILATGTTLGTGRI
jgi:hypothetical protein